MAAAQLAAGAIGAAGAERPRLQRAAEPSLAACPECEQERVQRLARDIEVGPLDDTSEREADAAAAAMLADAGAPGPASSPLGRIQASRLSGPAPTSLPASLGIFSAGRPLDGGARAFFEPRLGRDLSDVRLHTGADADASARALNARAYTLGPHIVAAGDTLLAGAWQRLLAHELTHVAQQTGPRLARTPFAPSADERPGNRWNPAPSTSARSAGLHPRRTVVPAPRIQRSPRTLPTRVGESNFLLTGGGSQVSARTTHFSAMFRPSGDISAIAGEGMTLRGLARMLLPIYARAAAAPGGSPAPTEDELAKAILDYDRVVLSPPAMSGFRAGTRIPLPVELDPNPGPVTHTRNDWHLDPDDVRTHAAVVSVAEAPLIDRPAAAAAPPPVAADVATFTAAIPGAAAQGMALFGRVLMNAFEGAPFATMVLAGMGATDRFEAAMAFMSSATNPNVTMLETLAPGFTLLQALRAALTAPPLGLAPAREAFRVSRVGMLPQDPAIAGISPAFLSSGPPGGALDRPNVIFFRRGRSSMDASETAKIPALRAANPGPVTLIGSTSEEEDPALALERTRSVEAVLRTGSAVADVQRASATAAGLRPSIGSPAYAEMRSVRVDPAPPAFEPDCHSVLTTHEPCAPGHAAVESRFTAAHTRALAIIDQARARMAPGPDAARDAAMRRRFGVVSHPHLRTRLDMLRATVVATLGSHECGTTCDAHCNSGSIAYSQGPGASPLMVICEGVLANDLEHGASVIIHESSHATRGLLQANPAAHGHPADWAYRWERMSGTITEMSPNPRLSNTSLDNADSYALFVMDLRDPALIPAGSQPIEEAPADDFQGAWTAPYRTRVRHGLADCQKWFIWAGQYLASAYEQARTGSANPTYGFASARFGGFANPPTDRDRARIAGLQFTVRTVGGRMKLPMRIEHAAAGEPTSFGAASPLLLLVGADALTMASDRHRGEIFVRKLIEAAPEIDPAQRGAYSGLIIDIRNRYEADH